jgi:hypothetical protein
VDDHQSTYLANWEKKGGKKKALIWNFLQLGLQIMLIFLGICATFKKWKGKNK